MVTQNCIFWIIVSKDFAELSWRFYWSGLETNNICGEYLLLSWVQSIELVPIIWALLSRFYLKKETQCSLRNIMFYKERTTDIVVQKHNICKRIIN
jgi:hypothetical protein